jgi:hypothetical protein
MQRVPLSEYIIVSARGLGRNPSEGCKPTRMSHRKAAIDCERSAASIAAWSDGSNLLYLSNFYEDEISVFLYIHMKTVAVL